MLLAKPLDVNRFEQWLLCVLLALGCSLGNRSYIHPLRCSYLRTREDPTRLDRGPLYSEYEYEKQEVYTTHRFADETQ